MPRSLYRTTPLLLEKTLHQPAESPELQSAIIIQVGSSEWFEWLKIASRFAYRLPLTGGRPHTITFRVETKQRGGSYWSAYMKDQHGKLHKLYVGRLTEITWGQITMEQSRVSLAYIRSLIALGRLPFLLGGIILYNLGVAIANHLGFQIDPLVLLWGQGVVTASQLMVHYSNDYFDLAADRANETPTNWSGGSRILVRGIVPPIASLRVALFFGLIAIINTIFIDLLVKPGPLTLPISLSAIALSWFYSAPPLRLHSQGIGELSATIVVGLLTPLFGFYLQTGEVAPIPILAAIPICLLQFNMLVSVAMPDAEGDTVVNKRTLVVRLGRAKSMMLYTVILMLSYLAIPIVVIAGLPVSVGVAFWLSIPLAFWIALKVRKREWLLPKGREEIAFLTIALLICAAGFELLAFLRLSI